MTTPNDENPSKNSSVNEETDVVDLGQETILEYSLVDEPKQVAVIKGPALSLGSETSSLLLTRLKAVLILAMGFTSLFLIASILGVKKPVTGGFTHFREFAIVRLVVYSGLLAYLFLNNDLAKSTLRRVEIVFFSIVVLLWIVQRYNVVVNDGSAGNLSNLLADRYQAIISLMIIMIAYGMFIPNRWQDTAKVVLTIALAPMVVLVLIRTFQAELFFELKPLITSESVALLLINLSIAAILSTYGAGILNAMRSEVHEARKFGQYQVVRKLGSGGMGEVYLAEHALLKRQCALKLINADSGKSPVALARFEREVQTTASLTHPNTIEIYDYGHTEDGTFYYVMEFLPGMSVGELTRKNGPLPAGRVIHLLRQVCRALAEAHDAGLIHRDLKPDNIFLSERGGVCDFVKVLDFGLVKLANEAESAQLTADHTVSGTPSFMSPEQATGASGLDGRCDIYSLGAIAYEMLTGRLPFEGDNPVAVMIAHASEKVVPPSELNSDIPNDLETVVLQCLAKKPDDRFEDVLALEEALSHCAAASDWDSRKAALWWHSQSEEEPEPAFG